MSKILTAILKSSLSENKTNLCPENLLTFNDHYLHCGGGTRAILTCALYACIQSFTESLSHPHCNRGKIVSNFTFISSTSAGHIWDVLTFGGRNSSGATASRTNYNLDITVPICFPYLRNCIKRSILCPAGMKRQHSDVGNPP